MEQKLEAFLSLGQEEHKSNPKRIACCLLAVARATAGTRERQLPQREDLRIQRSNEKLHRLNDLSTQ